MLFEVIWLNISYFWSWILNFLFASKKHMLMSWKPTNNNSYRRFYNSRLTVYFNPQRCIWKWLTKIIAHFVLFVFNSLTVIFLVGSILLPNSEWWTVYKNYYPSITDKLPHSLLDPNKKWWFQGQNYGWSNKEKL